MSDTERSIGLFQEMLERIGLQKALELQMSVALKMQDAIKSGRDALLTPQECAFMQIWIDYMVSVQTEYVLGFIELQEQEPEPSDPFEVGRPGGTL